MNICLKDSVAIVKAAKAKGIGVDTASLLEVEETLEDATSEVRQEQLDSDIRAREQRNDVFGEQGERTDADIESEVRAKLEANIPRSKLTIEAEEGNVQIIGTVPSQKEYESIEPLAQEIVGVETVTMEVEVLPSTES